MKKLKLSIVLCLSINFLFAQNKVPSIKEIWSEYKFFEKQPEGFNSLNDGKHYVAIDGNEEAQYLIKYDFKDGKPTDTILNSNTLPDVIKDFSDFEFTEDESLIMIKTQREAIYRRSYTANHWFYNTATKNVTELNSSNKQKNVLPSPDNNNVAYVFNNNIYIKNLQTQNEIQVTNDGKINEIINGGTDWVYEEEFELVQGMAWNNNGKYLAYLKFDESKVPTYTMQYFKNLYPDNYSFKYPKVGEINSNVSLHLYNTENGTDKTLFSTNNDWEYLPRFIWNKALNQLVFLRMNRNQNSMEWVMVNPKDFTEKIIYKETSDTYIDVNNFFTFHNNGTQFINISDKDGFKHLYNYKIDGSLVNQITIGAWEVIDFYGYDEANKMLYYQSTEVSPLMRHIFKVKVDGSNKAQIIKLPGVNNASFSKNFEFFLNTNSNMKQPTMASLYHNSGMLLRYIEDNKEYNEMLKDYTINYPETMKIMTSDKIELNGWIIYPHNYDSAKKYPVYMTQYSGPGSQEVLYQWLGADLMFYNYLASKGIIVACFDGRGTGGRGAAFQKVTYKNLGKYETIDQIEVAKYLGTLPFVDKERIGIFGWSYGGYMAARCLGVGADVFKLAVSVAPVTDWRFYDNIYTERYMQTSKENKQGYDSTSVLPYVKNIKGKLLLIHGLTDDNVHYQNTAMLLNTLYKNNIFFDQMTFPNKNHGIYGGNTRFYLFSKIADFVEKNL